MEKLVSMNCLFPVTGEIVFADGYTADSWADARGYIELLEELE